VPLHYNGGTMNEPPRHAAFELLSQWHVDAPIDSVWRALTQPEQWPRWWPYVRRVTPLVEGEADGLGSVKRFEWGSLLGYGLGFEVQTTEVARPHRLRGRALGELDGEGLWELQPDGATTRVRYLWRVDVTRPWMRAVAPLAAPLFRWNHNGVMRAGAEGLARHLGVRLLDAK
jgi:uncharacterized protein YndB with AHSA1/START domain